MASRFLQQILGALSGGRYCLILERRGSGFVLASQKGARAVPFTHLFDKHPAARQPSVK